MAGSRRGGLPGRRPVRTPLCICGGFRPATGAADLAGLRAGGAGHDRVPAACRQRFSARLFAAADIRRILAATAQAARQAARLDSEQRLGEAHAHGRAALAFDSKSSICFAFTIVRPMSSRPFSRQCLRWASISKPRRRRAPDLLLLRSISASHWRRARRHRTASQVLGRDLHRQHAIRAVVVKMSPNDGDHAADAKVHQRPRRVLREEPQPVSPATGSWLR